MSHPKALEVLVVDDNPGDVCLIEEALRDGVMPSRLHSAKDGEEALAFLRGDAPFTGAPRPDLVLLDLNMPRMGGMEVLRTIKENAAWKTIPTVVLTSSQAEADIQGCYQAQANAYLVKPGDLEAYTRLLNSIQSFWLTLATLPVG